MSKYCQVIFTTEELKLFFINKLEKPHYKNPYENLEGTSGDLVFPAAPLSTIPEKHDCISTIQQLTHLWTYNFFQTIWNRAIIIDICQSVLLVQTL